MLLCKVGNWCVWHQLAALQRIRSCSVNLRSVVWHPGHRADVEKLSAKEAKGAPVSWRPFRPYSNSLHKGIIQEVCGALMKGLLGFA